jgi:hypothetical protein
MLINSLLAHATDVWWEDFISQLERLNTRKAIIVGLVTTSLTQVVSQRLCTAPHELTHH